MTHAILFNASQVAYAYNIAAAKAAKFANFKHAHHANTPRKHFVGRLGEMAVYKFFEGAGFSPDGPCFREDNQEPDIVLKRTGRRVEVKSWKVDSFNSLGRAVALAQLPGLMEKVDVIVWAAVGISDYWKYPEVVVNIMGWNTFDDFQDARRVTLHDLENVQLPRECMREMAKFPRKALVAHAA